MRNSTRKRGFSLFTAAIAAAVLFSGCSSSAVASSSSTAASSAAASSAASQSSAKTKVVIATGGAPKPFTFVNDQNQLEGYDIELVKAVFGKLPQYEISFEKTEFTSIFAGLDSDRYQIGANNFGMNDQRKEKYIYSDPIFKNQFVIAVKKDRNDITKFSDLEGKTTEVSTGLNYAIALEKYNKDSAKFPVKLTYTKADLASILQHVENGQFDFQLIDAAMLDQYIKQYNLNLKTIKLSDEDMKLIGSPYSYLLIGKGKLGEQLSKDVNTALAASLKDGTITKISEKYFNADYAPKAQS